MNDMNVILFTERMRWGLKKAGLAEVGSSREIEYAAQFELAADDEEKFVELKREVAEIFRKIPVSYLSSDIKNFTYAEKKFFDQACVEISKIHEAEDGDELVKAMGEIKEFIEKNIKESEGNM